MNKVIKNNLKQKLKSTKGSWNDELPKVLWTYRTTTPMKTGQMPFIMTFGMEAVIPTEIGMPSFRTVLGGSHRQNDEGHGLNLDLGLRQGSGIPVGSCSLSTLM